MGRVGIGVLSRSKNEGTGTKRRGSSGGEERVEVSGDHLTGSLETTRTGAPRRWERDWDL